MKTLNLKSIYLPFITIVLSLSLFIISCGKKETTENAPKEQQSTQEATMKDNQQMNQTSGETNKDHVMIKVSSMQCGTCKKNIETAVKKVDGIIDINVDKEEKIAHVNFDKSKTDITKIENAITAAGYDANDKKADPKAYSELDDCCKLPKDQKEKSKH